MANRIKKYMEHSEPSPLDDFDMPLKSFSLAQVEENGNVRYILKWRSTDHRIAVLMLTQAQVPQIRSLLGEAGYTLIKQ